MSNFEDYAKRKNGSIGSKSGEARQSIVTLPQSLLRIDDVCGSNHKKNHLNNLQYKSD